MPPTSLWSFFAIQKARILDRLYPVDQNPPHASGPKRPDLAEAERTAFKRAILTTGEPTP